MSEIDELVANNEAYAERFDKGELPLPPARKLAIVACMDARLSPYALPLFNRIFCAQNNLRTNR